MRILALLCLHKLSDSSRLVSNEKLTFEWNVLLGSFKRILSCCTLDLVTPLSLDVLLKLINSPLIILNFPLMFSQTKVLWFLCIKCCTISSRKTIPELMKILNNFLVFVRPWKMLCLIKVQGLFESSSFGIKASRLQISREKWKCLLHVSSFGESNDLSRRERRKIWRKKIYFQSE